MTAPPSLGWLVALGLACGCDNSAPRAAPADRAGVATTCSSGIYGRQLLDAVAAIRSARGQALLFETDQVGLVESRTAIGQLDAAIQAALPTAGFLSPTGQVVVQNDLWGLRQRLDSAGLSTPPIAALRATLDQAIVRLALPPSLLRLPCSRRRNL